jgi:hypothetical protein
MLKEPPPMEAYLMTPGKVPYEGTPAATTGGILASKVTMPGMGMQGLGMISYDKIKDESQGETSWTYLYDVDTVSRPIHQENIAGAYVSGATQYGWSNTNSLNSAETITGNYYVEGPLIASIGYSINNFVVREITIRNYTVAEVWAGVGGLWAGSLLLVMIFFSTTDVSDSKHRLFRIFNFVCPSHRGAWIERAESEGSDDPFACTTKCKAAKEDKEA